MSRDRQPIDEYTLAAFLAGTLTDERYQEVLAYLAENADARELLCMASEAMEAAQDQAVAEPFTLPTAEPKTPSPAPRLSLQRTARPAQARPRTLRRAVLSVLAVLVLSVSLPLAWNMRSSDTLRGTEDERLEVSVTTPALQFRWNEVEEAYYYRLTIWDLEATEVVDHHDTKATRLGRNDAFVLSLHRALLPGRTYLASLEAFDVQNREILRSTQVEFMIDE